MIWYAFWNGSAWLGVCLPLRLSLWLLWRLPLRSRRLALDTLVCPLDTIRPRGAMPKEQEIAMLEDEARALERDLEAIRRRLTELRGE